MYKCKPNFQENGFKCINGISFSTNKQFLCMAYIILIFCNYFLCHQIKIEESPFTHFYGPSTQLAIFK